MESVVIVVAFRSVRFVFVFRFFLFLFWLIAVGHWTIFGHLATHTTHLRIFVKIQIEASCKKLVNKFQHRILSRDLCKLGQWLSNYCKLQPVAVKLCA